MRRFLGIVALVSAACGGSSSNKVNQVAAPTFSPPSGTYASAQVVTIASATAGATVHYTEDGTTPTAASPTCTAPVTVSATTTLQAIATLAGATDSEVVTARYVIAPPTPQAAAPTFSPPGGAYVTAQTVTMATTTAGATIHYTTDGSTPTAASPAYGAPMTVAASATVKAIAVAAGFTDSAVASATYVIGATAATPTFSPAGGTYTSAQTVTLAAGTAGATLRYTTDGSTPTATSTLYTSPITVSATTTLKAIAVASGYLDSAVASATYTIVPPAAAPTFSPGEGTFTSPQTVTLATASAGASIRYTLDGSTPTASSTAYTTALVVSSTTTLKAIATGGGFSDSPVASATYTILAPAAAPTFSPAGGTYTTTIEVTLASASSGTTIHYTLDGSAPTGASAVYGGPIPLGTDTTLKAIATGPGYTDSAVSTAVYTFNIPIPAATPTFLPPGGSYPSPQVVALATTTRGASIYYTTNGSIPTTASTLYTTPFSVSTTTTVKAIAVAPGFVDSAVASATFTILTPAATPTFTPPGGTYAAAQNVTIASTTAGAVIHYTLDGSTPTAASPTYGAPVAIGVTATLRAIAIAPGFTDSAVASASYTILTPAATPTLSPPGGTYTSAQVVTIATTTSGATIHYTLDGSTPTAASPIYTTPLAISTTTTLKAIAVASGFNDSVVAAATYTIVLPAEAPTFSPPGGNYTSAQTVTLTSATVGALIYYTLDGSTPATASTLYVAPFSVSATTTVKAIAKAPGFSDSAIASASYVISPPAQAATPTFSPAPGTFTSPQNVVIASTTPGAAIHYTTDGSTPTASSAPYTAPISVGTTTTIRAIATAGGFMPSDVAVGTFTIELPADVPSFSPAGGTYTSAQLVTLSSATAGASIHYTLDGSTPTATSTLYTAPFDVSTTTTVKAIAVAPGFTDSAVASATYTILVPAAAPTFTPGAGTYSATQLVTLATTTPGASIYYTLDGSTPTTSSTLYSAPISVSSTTTIKAIAIASGFTDSTVASAAYTFLPLAATPTFTPPGGTYTAAQNVTIATTTAGATIYYTLDGSTPTSGSTPYTSPIAVAANTTVQAIATAPGFAPSAVGSATYIVDTSSTVPLTDFCGQLVDANVTKMLACANANPDYATWFRQTFLTRDTCGQYGRDQSSGRVLYDGTKAAACVAAFQAATCVDLESGATFLSAACAGVFTPQVQPGDACYDDLECVGGDCDEGPGACPGKCQTFLAAGDDCSAFTTTRHCGPGLVCDGATTTCLAPSPANQACPCQPGLWCDTADLTFPSGTCKPQQTSGACETSKDQCIAGYVCVGSTTTGTCLPFVGLGADCSSNPCGLGYYCGTDQRCAAAPGVGADCSVSLSCIGGYCDFLGTKTCLAYKNVGDPCFMLFECLPGLACDAGVCANTTCMAP